MAIVVVTSLQELVLAKGLLQTPQKVTFVLEAQVALGEEATPLLI